MLYQNVSRLNNIFLFLASLHSSLKMSRSVDMISLRWSSIFMINRSPASSSIIFSLIAIMIIIISHAIDIIDNINNIAHHRHNSIILRFFTIFSTCLFRISLDHNSTVSFSRRSSFLSEQYYYYDAWKVLCEHDT